MGIKVINDKSKMPRALKLASAIASYLFEEEYEECKYMRASEIEALRKAQRALIRASNRTTKSETVDT